MESVRIEPQTSPPCKALTMAALPTRHALFLLQIILLINTLTVIPKTTHQAKRLKKNTNAERYVTLVNAETRLADGDNYSVAAV
jgi:hypothetical protein